MQPVLAQPPVATSPGAPVQVVDLFKAYGEVRAVDGVSLDVRAGEFLALLGPSGSGKTTILMTIAGFEQPTRGDVLIGGRLVTNVPPNRRDIGMVFQRYALFPHMSVHDNIAYPLLMRRVPRAEIGRRVQAALELVRLAGYGRRMPHQLSGGEQQRVALARAIVYRPPLLLMDEPLGALDKKLRAQLQLEIKHLQRQLGATVIYVTHDQEEALTMADRVAVLHRGRLQQIGTPEALYEQPANSFVADFVGETNFLDGRLLACRDGVCTVALAADLTVRAALPDATYPALAPGAAVRVAIRPERVRLARLGPAAAEATSCSGVLLERIYAGPSVACVVRLANDITITARVPSDQDPSRWFVGDPLLVSWRAEDARVYPAER